jgi:hypothetical protein
LPAIFRINNCIINYNVMIKNLIWKEGIVNEGQEEAHHKHKDKEARPEEEEASFQPAGAQSRAQAEGFLKEELERAKTRIESTIQTTR